MDKVDKLKQNRKSQEKLENFQDRMVQDAVRKEYSADVVEDERDIRPAI